MAKNVGIALATGQPGPPHPRALSRSALALSPRARRRCRSSTQAPSLAAFASPPETGTHGGEAAAAFERHFAAVHTALPAPRL